MSDPIAMKRRVLLILGMHRSGTSAVTRVVNLLGAQLGKSLIPPGHDNPSGFWESTAAVAINERLLRDLGRTWYDTRDMPDEWMQSAAAAKALDRAKRLIRRELSSDVLCALKDPRICLTAPLWIKAFEVMGFDVRCLFVLRDPRDVIESLHRRNGWPRSPLYLMWVQYLLEAEAATREVPRTMLAYEQLLTDWRSSMRRVSTEVGIAWPVELDAAGSAISAFLDRGQRHHNAVSNQALGAADATGMPSLVRSLYTACQEVCSSGDGWTAMANLHAEFRKTAELYAERVDSVLKERWDAEAKALTAEAKAQSAEVKLASLGSVEGMIREAAGRAHQLLETRVSSIDRQVVGLSEQIRLTGAERAREQREQVDATATVGAAVEQTRQALDAVISDLNGRLAGVEQEMQSWFVEQAARSSDTLASMTRIEKQVQDQSAEHARQWRDQASLLTGMREAVQGSHDAFERRASALEQNLGILLRAAQEDRGELDGRALRQQELLQAIEARLQRQHALLNTVLLSLEQAASDRLADHLSGMAGKIDGVMDRLDATRNDEMRALREELQRNRSRLNGLLASTSWRITKPLRWISVHLLRRAPGDG